MSRPFQLLRGAMYANEITQNDMARHLRISVHTISSRLNGHTEWTLEEIYTILDLLGQAPSEIINLFPRHGSNGAFGGRDRIHRKDRSQK